MDEIPDNIVHFVGQNPNVGRATISEKFGVSESEARYICRVLKGRRNKTDVVRSGVAIGDYHYPYQDKATSNIFLNFVEDLNPDIVILAGDMMENDTVSFHNRGKVALLEGKRLKKDYKGYQRTFLTPLEERVGDDCQLENIKGNHEYFLDRLKEEYPQYEGFVEMEENLDLERYNLTEFNDVLKIGKMHFIHGVYYNKYHAEKNVRTYGEQIFNWHVHTNQVFTNVSPITQLPHQGVSVGCSCTRNPHFLRGKPNAWINQFLYFYMFEDGTFTYYTPIVTGGRTVINGKIYEG